MKAFIYPLLFIAILFSACKKDEENTCENGFLDPGEEEVDCGGACEACPVTYTETMSTHVVRINSSGTSDTLMAMKTKYLTNDSGEWILHGESDSIVIHLTHLSDGSQGIYDLSSSSYLSYKGTTYDHWVNGLFTIDENQSDVSRMDGFFSADFYGVFGNDTVRLESGLFKDLEY